MSIIEKAVGRLEKKKAESAPALAVDLGIRQSVASSAMERTPNADESISAVHPVSLLPAQENSNIRPLESVHAVQTTAKRVDAPTRSVNINFVRLHELGIITPDSARSELSEEFRHIKRPLIDKAFRKIDPVRHGNLIMVTSSLPNEGKTFCAINLAMSIAMELDHTVLLVDADVARPSIPRYLGIESKTGLMDLLLDDTLEMSEVMLNTNVERLRILASGKSNRRATELLASLSMSRFLDEIATRYSDRIVIFDSPPVLLTSEARALASQMGQIVLVVAAETTTQHGVKDTISRIDSNPNISLVYNKSKNFPGMGDYGSYY